MNAIKFTQLWARAYLNIVRLLKLIEFYQPTYNPGNAWFVRGDRGRRESDDRFAFMVEHLPMNELTSYLDAGCQIGYFNFKMAEHNFVSHGFDLEPIVIGYCRALAAMYQTREVTFWQQDLTPESAARLPRYDVISLFSVYHHLVHFQGKKPADHIMKALFARCTYLVFETGQLGEKNEYWSESVKFMGDDVATWFKKYCLQHQFEVIAYQEFGNHLNDRGRTTFIAKKKSA